MIQIPLEIGDTILAGRFKNKKIKVNEIGTDDFGNPTINGRSILKIRIPKLYQTQETTMNEQINPNSLEKGTEYSYFNGNDWDTVIYKGKASDQVHHVFKSQKHSLTLTRNNVIRHIKPLNENKEMKPQLKENASKYFQYIKMADMYGWENVFDVLEKAGYDTMSYKISSVPTEGSATVNLKTTTPTMKNDIVVEKVYEDKKDGGIVVKTNKAFLKFWNNNMKESKQLKEAVSNEDRKFAEKVHKGSYYGLQPKRALQRLLQALSIYKKLVSEEGDQWKSKQLEIQRLVNNYKQDLGITEAVNPFQKSPLEVKIKQTDGSWHIYLQTVDGEECLTMTGWGTKEQAEHAATMKGYSFDANKSNETPTRDTPKYTGYEKVRSEKPEEMKLSKEKKIEIKLESMMRRILGKKKALIEADLSATVKEQLRNLKQLQQQIAEAKAQVDAVMKSTGLKDLEKSADKLLKEELWDFFNELKKDEQRLVDLGDIIMTVVKFQSEPATYEYEKTLDYALTQVNQDVKEKVLMQLKASEKIGKTKGSVSFATKTEAAGNSIWSSITNFLGKFIPALKRKGQKIDTELTKLKGLVAKIKK